MSGAIQSQADVGSLSLQGLSAFSSVLAILSADDVAPTAVIQLERLGAMLPTNGDYAEKVKTLLQRCSSNRLNHLALVVGWRKNDSASLMAGSAGGQAVALLSMCLGNLFNYGNCGEILSRLCSSLLPKSMNLASVSQLADVAELLAGKLSVLGFGNRLASEVIKIHKAYAALDMAAPEHLLENLNAESVTELLVLISRALREDEMICRISGVRGMGHVLGLLQVLCPRSTTVTIEGTVIQDTPDRKIIVEFLIDKQHYPMEIYLETTISTSNHIKLPIGFSEGDMYLYRFQWSGWLADCLQLVFLRHGLICNQDILDACCDLLACELELIQIRPPEPIGRDETAKLPPLALSTLLGPFYAPRVFEVCKAIWRAIPSGQSRDWAESFQRLLEAVRSATQTRVCTCREPNRCDLTIGWNPARDYLEQLHRKSLCAIYDIWYSVQDALYHGLCTLFIEPDQNANASITNISYYEERLPLLSKNVFSKPPSTRVITIVDLYTTIMHVYVRGGSVLGIASSHHSCTMYPAVLETLSIPTSRSVIFKLVDGQIVFTGRYYNSLTVDSVPLRAQAKEPLTAGDIRPSHIGVEPKDPLVSIREDFRGLTLLCSIQYAGNIVKLDLHRVIVGYMAMRWAAPCSHPADDCLDTSKYKAIATSVASPAAENAIGVAMTRWNPVAQFLCCDSGEHHAVLQRDCCLNCALKGIELSADPRLVIIVG
ncbi:MAG: hypothetical protein Q9195_006793 [Heterodermia aff. obscurata]